MNAQFEREVQRVRSRMDDDEAQAIGYYLANPAAEWWIEGEDIAPRKIADWKSRGIFNKAGAGRWYRGEA